METTVIEGAYVEETTIIFITGAMATGNTIILEG